MPAERIDIRFSESQPWWLNGLVKFLLPIESVILGAILLAVGSTLSMRDQVIIALVWLGLGVVLPAMFLSWRLTTRVTRDRIVAGFAGFPKWKIGLDRVEQAEIVRVDPIRELGGWGWRRKKAFGTILNVAGDHVVRVRLIDGSIRTIGTQRPDELAEAILRGALEGDAP